MSWCALSESEAPARTPSARGRTSNQALTSRRWRALSERMASAERPQREGGTRARTLSERARGAGSSGEAGAGAVATRVALVRGSPGDGDAFVFVRLCPITRSITAPRLARVALAAAGPPPAALTSPPSPPSGARRPPRCLRARGAHDGPRERPLFANSGRSRRGPRFGTPTVSRPSERASPRRPRRRMAAFRILGVPLSPWCGHVGKLATRGGSNFRDSPLVPSVS